MPIQTPQAIHELQCLRPWHGWDAIGRMLPLLQKWERCIKVDVSGGVLGADLLLPTTDYKTAYSWETDASWWVYEDTGLTECAVNCIAYCQRRMRQGYPLRLVVTRGGTITPCCLLLPSDLDREGWTDDVDQAVGLLRQKV